MRSIPAFTVLSISILLFACSEDSKPGQNGSPEHVLNKPTADKTSDEDPLQKIASDFENKVKSIRAERDQIDRFYDWTEVKTIDIWGTEGIGGAKYYYSGKELRKIEFYPEQSVEGERFYHYYFQKGKLFFARLDMDLSDYQANSGKQLQYSDGSIISVGNCIPATRNLSDRLYYSPSIDYSLNCFFENNQIFHQEMIEYGVKKLTSANTEKEKIRLKKEFKALMAVL